MPRHGRCCCCPPKADLSLPDSLRLLFSVASSNSTGMPADSVAGSCDGGDAHYRYSFSAAIVEQLTSIIFDFVEATSGGCDGRVCCYIYEGRADTTLDCPAATDVISLGESPFSPYAIADDVYELKWKPGGSDPTLDPACGPFDEVPATCYCCVEEWELVGDVYYGNVAGRDCVTTCGNQIVWTNGVEYTPTTLAASPPLMLVCVEGSVATVCLNINIVNYCDTKNGSGSWHGPTDQSCPAEAPTECVRYPAEYTGTYAEDCTSSTSLLGLLATVDLSAVSGATIWDKIKAAVFTSAYETLHCNCGTPACVGNYERDDVGCGITCGCVCTGNGDDDVTLGTDQPIDIDCLYAVGELDMTFDDE